MAAASLLKLVCDLRRIRIYMYMCTHLGSKSLQLVRMYLCVHKAEGWAGHAAKPQTCSCDDNLTHCCVSFNECIRAYIHTYICMYMSYTHVCVRTNVLDMYICISTYIVLIVCL